MIGAVNDFVKTYTASDFEGTGSSRFVRLNCPPEGNIVRLAVSVNSGTFSFALFNSRKAFNADGSLAPKALHYRVTPDLSSGSASEYSDFQANYYYHNNDSDLGRAGESGTLYLHLTPSSWTGLEVTVTVTTVGAV